MALFANITAADLKKGGYTIMFAMLSTIEKLHCHISWH
jgi:hypothetical protein